MPPSLPLALTVVQTQTYIPPLAYALADKSLENYDQFYIVSLRAGPVWEGIGLNV